MDSGESLFGVPVSDMQTDLVVGDEAITGTLKYIGDGTLAEDWGAGNFMALQLSDIDENATSVLVGLYPSEGSGLVEIINDPDLNGVFKVTDKDTQKFTIVTSDGTNSRTKYYDLSGLTIETE